MQMTETQTRGIAPMYRAGIRSVVITGSVSDSALLLT